MRWSSEFVCSRRCTSSYSTFILLAIRGTHLCVPPFWWGHPTTAARHAVFAPPRFVEHFLVQPHLLVARVVIAAFVEGIAVLLYIAVRDFRGARFPLTSRQIKLPRTWASPVPYREKRITL